MNTEPTITDWISSIGTLIAIPVGFWGIIKLFLKDKDKERKLNSLEELARIQNDQIQELARQTSEFQRQSSLMIDSNDLSQKHIEVLKKQIEEGKEAKEEDRVYQEQLRLNKIKPYFTYSTDIPVGIVMNIRLRNEGETAYSVQIGEYGKVSDKWRSNSLRITFLDKESYKRHDEFGFMLTAVNSNTRLIDIPINVLIKFKDQESNIYQQIFTSENGQFNITPPELIKQR